MSLPVQPSLIRQLGSGLALAAIATASIGVNGAIANPLPNRLLDLVDLFTDSPASTTPSPTATPASTSTPSTSSTTATPASTSTPSTSSQTPTTTQQRTIPTREEVPRFGCEVVNGQYTVMYYPASQPDQGYAWATPTELGGGWTPQARCNEISRRLEAYRPDNMLEMMTGSENGYDTICVTTEANASCRIVLTVPPGQDPVITRNRVFENLTVASSGVQTDAVTTFTNSGQNAIFDELGNLLNVDLSNIPGVSNTPSRSVNGPINLRPFLDPADGGTGRMLNN